MAIDTRYFVDVFGDVVSSVRSEYDTENVPVQTPYYMYGHILDILKRLSFKTASSILQYQKYPLICLIQDFEEQKNEWGKYEYIIPEVKVIIVTGTDQRYDSPMRYEKTFKPILYPIWDLLLTKMAETNYIDISSPDHIEYSKFDRVFWGREQIYGVDGNVFDDYLDAIEVRFKNLQIIKHSNC